MKINNLKGYKLIFKESAKKELASLDPKIAISIENKLKALIKGDENLDVKKMQGFSEPTYRLSHGFYRAIYRIYNGEIIVLIIAIGHRKDIYKRFKN